MDHDTPQSAAPVAVAQSALHHLDAEAVAQRYQVKVRLPEDYDATGDVCLALYLHNGDYMFAIANDIVQYLVYGGHVPDLVIVSPAYRSSRTPDVRGTNMRNRDLLPFPVEGVPDQSVGASSYLAFLERELIPFAETRYRIDSSRRILTDYSLGALIVVYAPFENPVLFAAYLAADGFAEQLWAHEEAFAARAGAVSARLCLASRSDPGTDLSRLADRLNARNLGGLNVSHLRLAGDDDDHFLVPGEALTRGLAAALAPWATPSS